MSTALRRIRRERRTHHRKAIVLIVATLVFANATALFGLTATARAGDFPNVLRYAPLTWEKEAPAVPDAPLVDEAAETANVAPVARQALDPVRTATTARRFSETRTTAFLGQAATHHRYLLIGLMTLALGAMAGVSFAMFRSLAREVSEAERRRNRF